MKETEEFVGLSNGGEEEEAKIGLWEKIEGGVVLLEMLL